MSTDEMNLGYDTCRHLDRWLDRSLASWENREEIRAVMLKLAASDPDYWLDRGWQAVHDKAWWDQ
jgi:hypothetical protein